MTSRKSLGLSYQSPGGAVQGMAVVATELGVGTLERGVPRRLGLLDAAEGNRVKLRFGDLNRRLAYPLRCALRDWLCCEEFLDSAVERQPF